MKFPTLPQQLNTRTEGERQERQRQRRDIMQNAFPGVKFSLCSASALSMKKYKGKPGVGVPQAIIDQHSDLLLDGFKRARVFWAYELARAQSDGYEYVTFTQVAANMPAGMTFQDIFGAVNFWRVNDPYSVALTVNRLGDATAFAVKKAVIGAHGTLHIEER